MSGFKRDRSGHAKRHHDGPKQGGAPKPVVRNAYTPMFERFRDELDEHHDRRERIIKASRDITALSKKIIFSLQRVRKIDGDIPQDIAKEMNARLNEIAKLLAIIGPETQGINRHRYAYSLRCLEELVEALSFAHYLKTQSLVSMDELTSVTDDLARKGAAAEDEAMADADDDHRGAAEGHSKADAASGDPPATAAPQNASPPPTVQLTEYDYIYGLFDLSGEMMRFATTTTALTGELATSSSAEGGLPGSRPRTIVRDMQDLGSLFEMLPQQRNKTWDGKMGVLRASVAKVERLGYGITVRGSEREKGWVPDMRDEEPGSPE
ncbi:Translin family-domain-containing protein [Phialemonium atrogriseum]|uniref:Translin family-domain-containing protein n=1 Tax=Phialemonium atrogriseum TaxID=1093897 RepID=A0AAJ0FB41_9PEZI|nr:Translin family-domain-containing protein [Phialemonium atrogriseum]KAK1762071.1 Translin family-domain-containing protein [Phialemonium atrogriseum]